MLLLLPVLTGFLLVASFPRFDQPYLAWIAFVPLIAYVSRVKTPIRTFWGGYVAGVIELFVLLLWMPAVLRQYGGLDAWLAWTGYVLLILLLSCFPAIACFVTKGLMRRGGDSFLLLFPAVWVSIEYVQTKIPFNGFPWLPVGYSQSNWLGLIQVADLTGVFGVSFLILWLTTAVVWIGIHKGRGLRTYGPLMTAVVLVFICLFYGWVRLGRWDTSQADFKVAMLQGNLSADDAPSVLADKYQGEYVRMADGLQSSDIDLMLLPESPTPVLYQWDKNYQGVLEGLARRCRYGLIFNNVRSEETEAGRSYFNSAFFLDGKGVLTGVYDKTHLVPFGEYIPLESLFVFMRTITRDVGAFQPGKDIKVLKLGEYPVNAIICFEAIFPDLVRRFVRNGSQLIVNLTNDEWYGDSSAPFQHFSIARWRAIENRRYFLRAANSGISAVIEPTGRIQTSTGILRKTVCEGRFAFETQQTFYTRYGDVFVFLCAIIVCSSSICIYTRGRRDNIEP